MAPISQSLSQVANQRVNRVLAPQLAQQTSYGDHQNAVIRAFANSLLGKLQPVAGQVGGDYDAAIKQVGGLSANAAQYLNAQNPVAQQQALQSSVGAPASQQAQAAQGLGDTFRGGAGVLAFTQGVVPGSELAGNKAAAMAQARALPAIGALAGQQSLASALYQQGQNRQTLEVQRPALVQQEEAQIQKTNLANAAIRQRAQAAMATAHYREAQLKETTRQHEATTKLGYAKVKQSAADKAAERAATKTYHDSYLEHLKRGDSERVAHDAAVEDAANTRNAIAQQQADTSEFSAQTGRINARTARYKATHPTISPSAPTTKKINGVTYQWDAARKGWVKSGLPADTAAKTKAKAPGPYPNLTKGQVVHLRSGIAAAFYGVPAKKDVNNKVTQEALPQVDYQAAIEHAVRAGYSRAAATKMANRFYMPGKRGRPGGKPAYETGIASGSLSGPPAPGYG